MFMFKYSDIYFVFNICTYMSVIVIQRLRERAAERETKSPRNQKSITLNNNNNNTLLRVLHVRLVRLLKIKCQCRVSGRRLPSQALGERKATPKKATLTKYRKRSDDKKCTHKLTHNRELRRINVVVHTDIDSFVALRNISKRNSGKLTYFLINVVCVILLLLLLLLAAVMVLRLLVYKHLHIHPPPSDSQLVSQSVTRPLHLLLYIQ